MNTGRMEAFTDGVMAVALTIMVLELSPPEMPTWNALLALWPVALSYVLSFIYVGLYWNNHHHLMLTADNIDGRVLWANLHWLFWVTLVPFTTAWMSETSFASLPVALYGFVLLMTGTAFLLMQREIVRVNGKSSRLSAALGKRDTKGMLSLLMYLLALAVVAWLPWLSGLLYAAVAALWFMPDRRFEKVVSR